MFATCRWGWRWTADRPAAWSSCMAGRLCGTASASDQWPSDRRVTSSWRWRPAGCVTPPRRRTGTRRRQDQGSRCHRRLRRQTASSRTLTTTVPRWIWTDQSPLYAVSTPHAARTQNHGIRTRHRGLRTALRLLDLTPHNRMFCRLRELRFVINMMLDNRSYNNLCSVVVVT